MMFEESGSSSRAKKNTAKRCVICERTTGHFEQHHPFGRIGADKNRTITVCAGTGGNTDLTSCHGLLHQRHGQVWIEKGYWAKARSVTATLHVTDEGAKAIAENSDRWDSKRLRRNLDGKRLPVSWIITDRELIEFQRKIDEMHKDRPEPKDPDLIFGGHDWKHDNEFNE